jgi:hypothetical protein
MVVGDLLALQREAFLPQRVASGRQTASMDFGSGKAIGVDPSSTTMANNRLHSYPLAEIFEPLFALRED